MLKHVKLLDMNLRTFDGGAAAGGAGAAAASGGAGDGGTGAAETGSAVQTQAETKKNGSSHRSGKKTGALSNVVYGRQDAAPAANTDPAAEGTSGRQTDVSVTSDTLEAKRAAFEELISGEYKDMFTERTQGIIDRRFKETKTMEAQLKGQQPVIDMLMSKYKITDGDVTKLQAAIEKDDTYWEEAADEAGLTVEQYRMVQKLQRENEAFRKAQQAREGREKADAQLADWYRQADALKKVYPSFDFKAELGNREFVGMLRNGIPVQKAYEVMHLNELVSGAATVAAQQAERNTVEKLRSRADRPAENGTSSVSSAVIKSDVRSLTKADRAEIARRAARGERIRF